MNTCQPIDHIVKLAEADGNSVLSISKSELKDKVIWMNNELSSTLRTKIQSAIEGLQYKKTKDMPHDPATEYFICEDCKTVVIFPLQTAK
jgi:hypothetical protein